MDDTKRGNISRLSDGEYGTEDPRLVNSGNIWRVRSFASSVLGSSIAAVSLLTILSCKMIFMNSRMAALLFLTRGTIALETACLWKQWNKTETHLQTDNDTEAVNGELACGVEWCSPLAIPFQKWTSMERRSNEEYHCSGSRWQGLSLSLNVWQGMAAQRCLGGAAIR